MKKILFVLIIYAPLFSQTNFLKDQIEHLDELEPRFKNHTSQFYDNPELIQFAKYSEDFQLGCLVFALDGTLFDGMKCVYDKVLFSESILIRIQGYKSRTSMILENFNNIEEESLFILNVKQLDVLLDTIRMKLELFRQISQDQKF